MRAEIKRLSKIEAEYLAMLDTHHGGSAEKMRSFMRTTLISADCPETLVQRWKALNNFRLDEESMFLLTKLLCSERIIKSRAMLIDFLKSTLDFEVVPEKHNDEVSIMAPKKKNQNHHQLIRTPDKIKSSRRNKTGTQAYELAYKQHLIFQDNTNRTGKYDLSQYPDLMENGESKETTNYAVLDVTKFKKYKTELK